MYQAERMLHDHQKIFAKRKEVADKESIRWAVHQRGRAIRIGAE